MIRALLLQLSNQLQDGHADLIRLYASHKTGIPLVIVLLEYLRRLIQRFRHTYIFLDALDESPRTGPREYILDSLETIQKWGVQSLHLFITSRDEPDIGEYLNSLAIQPIEMRNAGIDEDIINFISSRLNGDRRLRKLLPYHNKIQNTLSKGTRGV